MTRNDRPQSGWCGSIRSRLTGGLLAKAERGELALTLPIGLMRDPTGMVVKDPDLAVQERLELVFETFLKFRTVAKVMRVFNDRAWIFLAAIVMADPRWARATGASVASILKNPAYAGAFVFGRTRMHTPVREGASKAKARRPIEEWRIVLKDRYLPTSTGRPLKKSAPQIHAHQDPRRSSQRRTSLTRHRLVRAMWT